MEKINLIYIGYYIERDTIYFFFGVVGGDGEGVGE